MADAKPVDRAGDGEANDSLEPRRGFIGVVAALVGTFAGVVPMLAAAWTFLDPVTRRSKQFTDPNKPRGQKTEDGFIRVARLDEVPTDGSPLRVMVRDDVTNKWTFSKDEPIGEVFLFRRDADKGSAGLEAFTTVCPHLGCSISLGVNGKGEQIFKCPCHNSAFALSGAKIDGESENPSPRDMDSLESKTIGDDVYVKYENFHTARSEKVVKG